jgi:hypothetical protein
MKNTMRHAHISTPRTLIDWLALIFLVAFAVAYTHG